MTSAQRPFASRAPRAGRSLDIAAHEGVPARRRAAPRIGLALAGGGPLGAIYEIGALCALDEVLVGADLNDLHAYVGVSAGGFIAAALANGMTPRALCNAFIENDADDEADLFRPSLLMRPAWGEFAQRAAALPALAAQAGWHYVFGRRSLLAAFERLGRALPAGLLSGAAMEAQLRRLFERPGRTNDFRRLARRLVLVATDLDTGAAAPFGRPGWDHVPISRAVQASAALPGVYAPVEIDGRSYVDGALKKTLHASVLFDEGVELMVCLNPLVPFDASAAPHRRVLAGRDAAIPRMVDGGLPTVLSQTFRSLIHSRLELGLKSYEASHPGIDILLFEADQRDPQMFLANTFSLSQRRMLAEHAYQRMRADMRSRRTRLAATLARHGLALDHAVLDDADRRLVPRARPARATGGTRAARALRRLQEVLDDLEHALPARAG
jgi:NTE family protein